MIRNARHPSFAAALASALLLAGSASAQPRPEGAADPAAAFFDKGEALYKQSRFAEAEAQLQQAWDLRRSFDVAADLGDCELEIGQSREAAEHLAYAVREFPPSGKAALRERLQQRLALARERVGTLKVRVSVPGAEVLVDGKVIGLVPLADDVFVDPGTHVVEARLRDYEAGRASVEVAKGAAKDVAITLTKRPEEPPPPVEPEGPNQRLLTTGAVIAGAGAGLGVVLSIVSATKGWAADGQLATLQKTGLRMPCPTHMTMCAAIDRDRGLHDALGKGALGAFIGAAMFAFATGGYVLVAPKAPPRTGVQVAPVVGLDRAGVAVVGVW
jgi:hypothetical protein